MAAVVSSQIVVSSLDLQRKTAAGALGECLGSVKTCQIVPPRVFDTRLRARKCFEGLNSSNSRSRSEFRISSALRTDDGGASMSVQEEIPIPKGSDVDEEDLEGLTKEERLEAVQDAKLALHPERGLLEKPTDLEDRGKEEKHPFAHLHVGQRWREIQGANQWAGLLEPLDEVLRGEIMRYGEFAQVAYDAFDYDTHSHYCGSAKYHKKRLLERVGLLNRGYEVTDYIYATSGHDHPIANFFRRFDFDDTDDWDADEIWDKECNWMGFVAVATDEEEIARLGRRDIVIVWRGTVSKLEWLENLRDYLAPSAFDLQERLGSADIKIEAGFLNVYTSRHEYSAYTKRSAREQVHSALKRLVRRYKDDEMSITVTGHSLGSALAHVCAYDLAENDFHFREEHPRVPVNAIPLTVFSFAGPRVGNDAFKDRMEELGVKVLRLVNKHDRVPKVPGILLNERLEMLEEKAGFLWNWIEKLPWTYTHCGVSLEIDNLDSPFLRKSKDALNAHNLEAYIHLVNGYRGKNKGFEPAIPRDIALINKASDFLRPKHSIPPSWWQEENKGLMRTKEGRWVPRVRDPDDVPMAEDLEHETAVNFSNSS
ncbi:phospholipase A1 [Marchantia polymorpha subsp. ruderalis]|nr:hypothetical protein MARPO_0191s0003 [Marchantia polymorpha]BBN03437.1 hypothetical protein Mp_2g23490 [Marchantia polymorpha subsp. ruderalis]|eukprot:PTQ27585.1 hypothetical protein MARPO_0191s0003 [Marchantia polymorpha]